MVFHSGFPEVSDAESGLKPLDLTGRERQLRSAVGAMERIASCFARSARRSMPFLARYRTRIVPSTVGLLPSVDPNMGPSFSVKVVSPDSSGWASVTLDSATLAITLEGALGGTGAQDPSPLTGDLTQPQRALVMRIARSLANDLAAAVKEEVGLTMALPKTEQAEPANGSGKTGEALYVSCEVEGLPIPASIVLAASAEALEAAARELVVDAPTHGDPRIADALMDVPMDVVAELGRARLGIRRVLSLRVGDVIRLPTATDDAVTVRIAGVEKFAGVPVTSRGQLAIEIRSRS